MDIEAIFPFNRDKVQGAEIVTREMSPTMKWNGGKKWEAMAPPRLIPIRSK